MTTKQQLIENCKCRSIETCIWHLVSQGMAFMVNKITEDELKWHKEIIWNHLKNLPNEDVVEIKKIKGDRYSLYDFEWNCLCKKHRVNNQEKFCSSCWKKIKRID